VRYIGETRNDTFYKRIASRHVTGSEGNSHKFSCEYNVGRMWRGNRKETGFVPEDAKIAKNLRTAFIHRNCRAIWIPVPGKPEEIKALEQAVIRIAPPEMVSWNDSRSRQSSFGEPVSLVDALIRELNLDQEALGAIDRQRRRYQSAEQ
jgi:DNA polymerase-3 subunit epsilon